MKHKVYDIHAHVVPAVDDGATNLKMSMEMFHAAYDQGTRSIVCTSHNIKNRNKYFNNFQKLQKQVHTSGLDINLYHGCEIYCSYDTIEHIIVELKNKNIPTINYTQYVLVEFSPYIFANEIVYCVRQLHRHGYKTIIAHTERYKNLFIDKKCISFLQHEGCLFQVNAYSFNNESKKQVRDTARKLLSEKHISFIGSDAHRTNHRMYMIEDGIDYIYKHCNIEYAQDICYKNAKNILNMK